MIHAPLILIGADHRRLGKSTLISHLGRRLTKRGVLVVAVKIRASKDGRSGYFFETRDEAKESVRAMFDAGCREVIHIEADDEIRRVLLADALMEIGLKMEGGKVKARQPSAILVESNALRFDLTPTLFIHIEGDGEDVKASAKKTKGLADILLLAPFNADDIESIVNETLRRWPSQDL